MARIESFITAEQIWNTDDVSWRFQQQAGGWLIPSSLVNPAVASWLDAMGVIPNHGPALLSKYLTKSVILCGVNLTVLTDASDVRTRIFSGNSMIRVANSVGKITDTRSFPNTERGYELAYIAFKQAREAAEETLKRIV